MNKMNRIYNRIYNQQVRCSSNTDAWGLSLKQCFPRMFESNLQTKSNSKVIKSNHSNTDSIFGTSRSVALTAL